MEVECSTKILKPAELIEHGNTEVTAALKFGAKRNFPEGTLEEEELMKGIWESRKNLCKREKVSRMKNLMTAEWDSELKVASTSKLKGKSAWYMGTSKKGKFYLTPEETVFLMESGRLELFHCGMPVSIEEAMFLAFSEDLSFEKYQVYSYLVKAGFAVISHQKKLDSEVTENISSINEIHNKKSVQQQLCTVNDSKASDAMGVNHESQSAKCEVIAEEQNANSILPENTVEEKNRNTPLNLSVKNSIDFISEVEFSAPYKNIVPQNTANCIERIVEHFNDRGLSKSTKLHSEFPKELPCCSKMYESTSTCNALDTKSSTENFARYLMSEDDQVQKSPKESNRSCILIEDDDYSSSGSSTIIDVDTIEKNVERSTVSNKDIVDVEFKVEENKELLCLTSEKNCSASTCNEEDVVFLEVKKKETKPLAVINLTSDSDSESDQNQGNGKNCNEIEVSMRSETEFVANIDLHYDISQQILNTPNNILTKDKSTSIPPWPFPDFAGKTVVCLPRPPAELLPPNVTPMKNFYPIDIDILSKSRYATTKRRIPKGCIYGRSYARTPHSRQPTHIFFDEPTANPSYGVAPHSLMNLIEHAKESSGTSSVIQDLPTEQFCVGQNSLPFLHPNGPIMEYPKTSKQPSTVASSGNLSEAGPLDNYDNHGNNYACSSNYKSSNCSKSFQQDPYQNSYHGKRYRESRLDKFHCPPSYIENYDMTTNYRSSSNICRTDNTNVAFSGKCSIFNPDKSSHSNYKSYTQQDGPRPARPYSRHPPHWQARQKNKPYRNRRSEKCKKGSYPCVIEKVPSFVSSWSEYQFALKKKMLPPIKESIQQPAFKIDEVLWSRDIHPLLSPTDVLNVADVLELLNITHSVDIMTRGHARIERSTSKIGKLEISFDVYLPRPGYKKTNPGIPNHRIIVTRLTDPFPKLNALVALNRVFNDTATLLFAIVDGGDISFYNFKDISLPTMYPTDNISADNEKNA